MSGPQRRASGLTTETRGHVRVLTLDRPERRNALSSALQADLVEELLSWATDLDVWGVALARGGGGAAPPGPAPPSSAVSDHKETREPDRRGDPSRPPMNRPGRNLFEVL